MDKTTAAVIIDYDHYLTSDFAQEFVEAKRKHASMIIFNSGPPIEYAYDETEWDVVISNNGNLPKEQFLVAALSALSLHSNVYPVIALDNNEFSDIYTEAGVLLVISD